MVIDKNYFVSRLQNGESIDNIGNEIAAMMNQAVAEHQAKMAEEAAMKAAEQAAIAEKEAAKRELIEELAEIIQELAILEGLEPSDVKLKDEDVDQLVEAVTGMFNMMKEIKKLTAAMPTQSRVHTPACARTSVIAPSDDQILADFIKHFN
jgi:hypothetical protein